MGGNERAPTTHYRLLSLNSGYIWHPFGASKVTYPPREYDPITSRRETGFVTLSVLDPFGNVLGIMYNPHYVALQAARAA